jgi:hypothetical protein
MALPRAHRIAVVTLVLVASAAAATGITYAATTTTTKVVYACANRGGTLKLLAKGECPSGYAKVAINKTGPRGPRGLTGSTGPAGPVAVTVNAADTDGTVDSHDVTIPGMGLAARATCTKAATASFSFVDNDATAGAYDVLGDTFLSTPGSSHASLETTTSQPIGSGLLTIDFTRAAAGGGAASSVVATFGTGAPVLTASMAVKRNGKTALVKFDLSVTANDCFVRADVTPATSA